MNPSNAAPLQSRRKELFAAKSARVAESCLRRLESQPDAPEAIKPFLGALRRVHVELRDAERPRGMKTVGTLCAMIPNELIYAAGAMPVRLCSGSYVAHSIGDESVPRDACPLVKAVMGLSAIGVSELYDNCSLMVVPTTCDCKKKLAGLLEETRPTAVLQIPANKDEDADTERYVEELYRLIPALEEAIGRRITAGSLAEGIRMVGEAQYEMSRFLKYRRHSPALMYGSQVMALMNAYSVMPAPYWAGYMRKLNHELAQRLAHKRFPIKQNRPRLLITGSPVAFPNLKIPLLVEEMGGLLAADETCMGERGLYDPLSVVDGSFDGMLRALAARYTRPCTCPVFSDNRQRLYRVRQMIREHEIQGVIYHVLRGCLVYDYEYQIFEEEMGKLDIPIIRLESDYNEEDVEQLRIRIEAFIELIKLKDWKGGD